MEQQAEEAFESDDIDLINPAILENIALCLQQETPELFEEGYGDAAVKEQDDVREMEDDEEESASVEQSGEYDIQAIDVEEVYEDYDPHKEIFADLEEGDEGQTVNEESFNEVQEEEEEEEEEEVEEDEEEEESERESESEEVEKPVSEEIPATTIAVDTVATAVAVITPAVAAAAAAPKTVQESVKSSKNPKEKKSKKSEQLVEESDSKKKSKKQKKSDSKREEKSKKKSEKEDQDSSSASSEPIPRKKKKVSVVSRSSSRSSSSSSSDQKSKKKKRQRSKSSTDAHKHSHFSSHGSPGKGLQSPSKSNPTQTFEVKNGCCKQCLKAFSKSGKSCLCQVPEKVRKTALGKNGCKYCGCKGCNPEDTRNAPSLEKHRKAIEADKEKNNNQPRVSVAAAAAASAAEKQQTALKGVQVNKPKYDPLEEQQLRLPRFEQTPVGRIIMNQMNLYPPALGFFVPQRSYSYIMGKSRQQ